MRNQTQIHALCFLLWNTALLFADEPKSADKVASLGTVRDVECEAEDRLIGLLNKRIRAEWSNVSLVDALTSIAAQQQIEIRIDHQQLKEHKVSIDHMVDVHLGDASIWQALHFLIPRDLGWSPSPGRLVITSHDAASYGGRTRIYDVKRIVEALEPGLLSMRDRHLRVPSMGFFSITDVPVLLSVLGENTSPMSKEEYGVSVDPNRNIVESRLIELLAAMWLHNEWHLNIPVEIGEKRLVVRASHDWHFRIQGMLLTLEKFIAEPANVNQFIVRRPNYPHAEDASIFQALAKVRDFDGKNLSLRAALNTIAKEHGIRLHIDQIEWPNAKLAFDEERVTLRIPQSPMSTILHRLLDPHHLAYFVEEGALVITTRDQVEKYTTVTLYNLKGIPGTDAPTQFLKTIEGSLQEDDEEYQRVNDRMFMLSPHCLAIQATPGRQAQIEDLLNRWRTPPGAEVKPPKPQLETRIYPVVDSIPAEDLIKSLPDLTPGWDPKQTTRRLGNTLVITQSPLVHERLERVFTLLKTWHQYSSQQIPATAKP